MSSAGGAISGESRQYFCHQCERTITISPSSGDLICPNCNGTFVEELETPIPNPNPIPPLFSYTTDFPIPTAAFPLDDLSAFFGNRSSPSPFGNSGGGGAQAFNPFEFFQNYLQARGNHFQFVIQNPADPTGAFRIPGNANPGDYFFGPGLEELIQQLAENDPSRRGPPPASKAAVEGLPDIAVTEELLATDSAQCAVCKDTFELGETAKQMPCKHIYHKDCILPWLELHNSCPVCRYELPTDDPDYEQRNRGGGNGGGTGDGGDDSQRRRFRVSLPWPFRQVSSSSGAETSNVNNNNSSSNSGNNNEQSNTESRGNRSFESETRQEDLD